MTTDREFVASATQVGTFEDCARKWAFIKIEGLKPPPNRFASFGIKVHDMIARWFEHREPPFHGPEADTAQAILRHLPPPQTPGIEIEQEIRVTLGGVKFRGFVDFRILDRNPRPLISDHKTASDLCWAKQPNDLPGDIQATIYAYDGMCSRNVSAVDLQWTYATTRGTPKSLPVIRTVTLEEITPRLEKTAKSAAEMREIFEHSPAALEVPYDAGACEKYGGCPFVDRCNLSATERIQSIMAQETEHSSFLSKLRAKRAAASNGAATASPHPAPAESAPAPAVNAPEKAPEPEPAPTDKTPEAAASNGESTTPPEDRPSQKRRRGRPRKNSTPPPAETAAESVPKPEPEAGPPPPAAAASTPRPAPAPAAPAAPSGDVFEIYRRGFLDGFAAGREVKP